MGAVLAGYGSVVRGVGMCGGSAGWLGFSRERACKEAGWLVRVR